MDGAVQGFADVPTLRGVLVVRRRAMSSGEISSKSWLWRVIGPISASDCGSPHGDERAAVIVDAATCSTRCMVEMVAERGVSSIGLYD